MMDRELIQLLDGASHDPFRILGPHEDGSQVAWRALLPDAASASIEGSDDTPLPMTRRAGTALFEWQGSRRDLARFPRLVWTDADGNVSRSLDAYQFRPKLSKKKLAGFNAGSEFNAYRLLGAHAIRVEGVSGVRFAVWAPNAKRVSVVGDFNRWHGLRHMMRAKGHTGIWVLFVPEVEAGAFYKFEIRDDHGVHLKADPFAFRAEHRPGTASIVVGDAAYPWRDEPWLASRRQWNWLQAPQTIYEVHLGSWRRPPGSAVTYRGIAADIVSYARTMGFTHIELLPIAEHPLDDSWGYQTTGYYAPTSRYGEPDDLRYLIDHAHAEGIGVFLDWTPAHFPKDAHGLALFDGTHLYEHADPRLGEHPDWNTLVFNYGRNEVRSFLLSNAAYWIREYHFDGLRVDAVASMLYLDYSRKKGEWLPNEHGGNENLAAMAFLRDLNVYLHREFPGVLVMAEESTSWPMVSRPVHLGGLGFSMKWNLGWMHDTLTYFGRDPVHRKFHHEALTFALIYAYHENFILPLSHDEVVHGKRSMLMKMPGDRWRQLANLRLLYCLQCTMPGRKLTFMGNELAAETEWDFRGELNWSRLDDPGHRGVQRLVADLNALVRSRSALHQWDFEPRGFRWLDCNDAEHSVLAYLRAGDQGVLVCLLNLTPLPRLGYRLGVPAMGAFAEILNSDSEHYGGTNLGNLGTVHAEAVACMGQPASIVLNLPPLGALILEQQAEQGRGTGADG